MIMSRIFSGAEPGPQLTWTAMARAALRTWLYLAFFPDYRLKVFVIDTIPADGGHCDPPASFDDVMVTFSRTVGVTSPSRK